ncbi:MAG: DUF6325 family protein [Candidatus Saccharimonadales bacterium]
MLGPIDYVAIGFEGNNFNGSILSELSRAVDSKAIRVVDLMFITKDSDGEVSATEIEDQSDDLIKVLNSLGVEEGMPLLAEQDVEKIGESMQENTSAGILIIEHLWAKALKSALMDANGILIAEGRIHPDNVAAAIEELNLDT